MSVLPGCSLPAPASITFDARPEAVTCASVGAAATSVGAGIGSACVSVAIKKKSNPKDVFIISKAIPINYIASNYRANESHLKIFKCDRSFAPASPDADGTFVRAGLADQTS
jgi:hypothetical protein